MMTGWDYFWRVLWMEAAYQRLCSSLMMPEMPYPSRFSREFFWHENWFKTCCEEHLIQQSKPWPHGWEIEKFTRFR